MIHKYVLYLKYYNSQTPWFKSFKRRPEWEKRTGMVDAFKYRHVLMF